MPNIRIRYTELMCVVDTHVKPENAEQETELARLLLETVDEFVTPAVLREVLPCADPRRLRNAELHNAAVEEGSHFGRIHVHFNLTIEHQTLVYLQEPDGEQRNINRVFAAWFDSRLEPHTGRKCFVSCALQSSKAKEYATKSGVAHQPVSVAGLGAPSAPPK